MDHREEANELLIHYGEQAGITMNNDSRAELRRIVDLIIAATTDVLAPVICKDTAQPAGTSQKALERVLKCAIAVREYWLGQQHIKSWTVPSNPPVVDVEGRRALDELSEAIEALEPRDDRPTDP